MKRVPREHRVGRVAFVLVAEKSAANRLDALLEHRDDHGFRYVDSDDPRHVRRDRARKRARTSSDVNNGARRTNA